MSRFKKPWMLGLLTAGLMLPVLPAPDAEARIRLVTLPVRERVEVQLDHEHATLVEEERIVPLVAGRNQIDFSWANTHIDPNTIVFRVLGPADGEALEANVLAVNYPPNENALVWDVSASRSGSARVRISYLLGGLNRSFTYHATASHDESTLTLLQYVRVHNFAAEAYGDTSIFTGYGNVIERPLGSNETRQMLVARHSDIPVVKTYTCDPSTYGWQDQARNRLMVPMHYVIRNDDEHGLGGEPLPYGKARIYQRDSRGTVAFLGEDWGQFTPIDDEMRLSLGVAQDVIVERTVADRNRTRLAGNLYRVEVVVQYEVQNTKDTPIRLDVLETIQRLRQDAQLGNSSRPVSWQIGERTTLPTLDPERTNIGRVAHTVELPAREGDETETQTYLLHVVFHNEF